MHGIEAANTVRVYDSLGTPLPLQTKKQIASLLRMKEKLIRIEFANVQVSVLNSSVFTCFNCDMYYTLAETTTTVIVDSLPSQMRLHFARSRSLNASIIIFQS